MKQAMKLAAILVVLCTTAASAQEPDFDRFLRRFDYETRADMKIDSKRLVALLAEKKAVLVDIRFPEETQAWKMGFGLHIPLNALPARWQELPRDKIVVVACPHKDRSAIAMAYLRSKGYDARYLTDGLIGLAERLRATKPGNSWKTSGRPRADVRREWARLRGFAVRAPISTAGWLRDLLLHEARREIG